MNKSKTVPNQEMMNAVDKSLQLVDQAMAMSLSQKDAKLIPVTVVAHLPEKIVSFASELKDRSGVPIAQTLEMLMERWMIYAARHVVITSIANSIDADAILDNDKNMEKTVSKIQEKIKDIIEGKEVKRREK